MCTYVPVYSIIGANESGVDRRSCDSFSWYDSVLGAIDDNTVDEHSLPSPRPMLLLLML